MSIPPSASRPAIDLSSAAAACNEDRGGNRSRSTVTTGAEVLRGAVSVAELQRAWVALQSGRFRDDATPADPTTHALEHATEHASQHGIEGGGAGGETRGGGHWWTPLSGEVVVPVVGCAGSMGTSTVALSLATAAAAVTVGAAEAGGGPAPQVRVVECGSSTTSGLAAASTAELGVGPSGWRRARRGPVLVQRFSYPLMGAARLPVPINLVPIEAASSQEGCGLVTVLDVGIDLEQLLGTGCWLREVVIGSPSVVAVTWATVRGLRRLEGTLELLDRARSETRGARRQPHAAVVGPALKKWPKGVTHSAGPHSRRLIADGRLVSVPQDRGLAVRGLDSVALPPSVLDAGRELARRTTPSTRTDDAAAPITGTGGTGARNRGARRETFQEAVASAGLLTHTPTRR